jgi:MoxR-like ATPase
MSPFKSSFVLDETQAHKLEVQAARVFQPRAPVSVREFFAGRWNQITTLADAVSQTGLHVVIYGERGVGKTSLANIVKPIIEAFDDPIELVQQASDHDSPQKTKPSRIVIKANANSGYTFSSIWKKLLEDLTWLDDSETIGYQPKIKGRVSLQDAFGLADILGVDDVRRVVSRIANGPVFIVDEFDRAAQQASREFTDP